METETERVLYAKVITNSVKYRSWHFLLLFLAVCYLLQLFSPLRLNNDAIVLLSMGESGARGDGFLYNGQKAVFPPGYPALLTVLLRMGFAHPWVIVGLNMVFIAVGLFASYSLLSREFFEDKALALMTCSLFLLSFVVIKHSTLPLTDVPFFGCSMSCIAVMNLARSANSNWRLAVLTGVAAVLALAAMAVRTIGAALFPSLIFMVVGSPQSRSWLKGLSLRTKLIIAGGVAFVGGAATLMLATTPYWRFFARAGGTSVSTLTLESLYLKLVEFGELFVNFPSFRLPRELHVVLACMGLFLILLILQGLATKRKMVSPIEVFLVFYMGVMFLWPFYDARYWLPVIPLLIAYTVLGVKSLSFPKAVVTVYCVAYAAVGFAVIAYSSRITFAGPKFPDRYGDGNLRSTYCAAFQSCPDGSHPNNVNDKVLRLLQEYK